MFIMEIDEYYKLEFFLKKKHRTTLQPVLTYYHVNVNLQRKFLLARDKQFPVAGLLWTSPEAARFPTAHKCRGWVWFNGEILNFLIYEALIIFINCPILLGLIHGLGKSPITESLQTRISIQVESFSGIIYSVENPTFELIRRRCMAFMYIVMVVFWYYYVP